MATEQSSGMGSLGRALPLSLHFPGSCGLPELAQPLWESKVYAEPTRLLALPAALLKGLWAGVLMQVGIAHRGGVLPRDQVEER